ncbi:MAG TPA: hypothetical protein DD405_04610 [Desulfobacteraceae bacterium]|nr:hypothetical protein [Desulfobacteraceae bacterium]
MNNEKKITTKKSPKDEQIKDMLVDEKTMPANNKESQASLMISLAMDRAYFFHTHDGEPYACYIVEERLETAQIKDKSFQSWLNYIYYKETGKPISPSSLQNASRIFQAEAEYKGTEEQVYIRYANHGGNIYIDLANKRWEQIEITKGQGWKIIAASESPVKFRRVKGMAPLSIPSKKASFTPLKTFFHFEEEDYILTIAWLIGSMNPKGPFPVMALSGEQGTAKSTTSRILKDIIDPSTTPLISLPRNERDLAIAADGTWSLLFDNISKLSGNMSDALCRISTGGGFRTRALYSNNDEIFFNSTRPIIINGISDFIIRQDLADRSIIINLPFIPENRRMPERKLWSIWENVKPLVLGALCNTLSTTLLNIDNQNNNSSYSRMADFECFVEAAESVLPWKKSSFRKAYRENKSKIIDITFDSDDVAGAVLKMIEQTHSHEFTGSPTELLKTLDTHIDDKTQKLKEWPKKPNILSNRLKRCAPFLRAKGILLERGKSGQRYIKIYKTDDIVQSIHKSRSKK